MSELINPDEDDKVDPVLDNYLRSERVIAKINESLPDQFKYPPIPKDFKFRKPHRESVGIAYSAAFELMGGVPAFLHWGANNQTEFYKQWATVIGKGDEIGGAQGLTINFQTAVPSNALDRISVDKAGNVIDIGDSDMPD